MKVITDTSSEVLETTDTIHFYPKYVVGATNTQHLVASAGLMKLERVREATTEMVVQAVDFTFMDELYRFKEDPEYPDSKCYFLVLIM